MSYRVNREGTMVMYSAERSSAVVEPNPIPPGLQIAEAAGPASLNLDASVGPTPGRVRGARATGRKARAGPAQSILPRSFYTTHRQVNGGVDFPPDTPTAVRNARHMQPIERARADGDLRGGPERAHLDSAGPPRTNSSATSATVRNRSIPPNLSSSPSLRNRSRTCECASTA